ncbi:MAG TPA: DUF222 domain-containing protein [Acidimicrobiales bacterium]
METVLAALCGELDPVTVPLPDAPAVYEALAHMEKLAAGAKLRMASRVTESLEWRRRGWRSPAEWLARTSGTSTGAAHAELATSQRLAALAHTDEAVRHGQLSAPQATAIADAATADPSAEGRLVAKADRSSLQELRQICARTKAAADPDPDGRYERIRRERALRTFTDHEGAWNLQARGPVDAGARVMAALRPLIDDVFSAARLDGRRESPDAYAFDALVELADHVSTAPSETSARSPATKPKHLTLLRVDLDALVRGAVGADELCELTGFGPIPVQVARDALGDSILHLILTRGHEVAGVVHLGRGPSAAQKIALLWSQPACSRAGCDQPWTHTQVDHRVPWAQAHETTLDNLDRLCTHDHRLKTHHGWALVHGTGRRDMVPPDDPQHPSHDRLFDDTS